MAILIPNFDLAEKIGRQVEIDASTVEELVREATSRFGQPFVDVIKHSTILVNGRSVSLLKGGKTPLTKTDKVWLVRPSGGG